RPRRAPARACRAPRQEECARDKDRSARRASLTTAPVSAGGDGCRAMSCPGQPDHGDDHAEHARELWHAEIADPEAVEPKGLDRETPDRVEADVAKEERAGILTQPWPKPRHERHEDGEVPQRLVEERRVEVLELPEAGRTVRRRDVELPGH